MLRLPTFAYHEPATLDEAIARKEDAGDQGTFVAGGTDLYPNMKRRHQEPATVIALSKIPSLAGITPETGDRGCRVAAMTTLTEIVGSPALDGAYRVVSHAAALVSTPLLRNMGTIGGNLCLDTRCTYYNQSYEWRKSIDFCMKKDGAICWVAPKSPRCWAVQSSDLAPVMVALGADLVLRGRENERIVPAARFYHDDGINYLTKQPHEMLTEVRLPARNGWDVTYWKLRRRGSFDFPVLGVAAWVRWDDAKVADARIVLGGVASYPQIIQPAADAIIGSALEDDAVGAAANAAFKPSKPMDNTDFGLAWRKEMTRLYVRRALTELRSRHH